MSPIFGFFPPNDRNAITSAVVPMPTTMMPAPRTIVIAR